MNYANYIFGGIFIICGLIVIIQRTLNIVGEDIDYIVATLKGPSAIWAGIALILIGIAVVLFV